MTPPVKITPCDASPWVVENDEADCVTWRGLSDENGRVVALVVSDMFGDPTMDAVTSLFRAAPDMLRVLECLWMAIDPDKCGVDMAEAERVVALAKGLAA